MIKCRVVEKFYLKDFDKLKNIERKSIDVKGTLFVDDTFECDEEMAKYLTGKNAFNKAFVEIIEVIPKEEIKEIEFPELPKETKKQVKKEAKTKTTKKKANKK